MDINWTKHVEESRSLAEREGKLVLIALFSPDCLGCQRMTGATFADPGVQDDIHMQFVPLQLNVKEQPSTVVRFGAAWTPTVLIQDPDGHEYRRCEGFFSPRRFRSELALGHFKSAFDQRDFKTAHERIRTTLKLAQDDPLAEPEAMYWAPVTEYKLTQDAKRLAEGWMKLIAAHPGSAWAKRAEFIRS